MVPLTYGNHCTDLRFRLKLGETIFPTPWFQITRIKFSFDISTGRRYRTKACCRTGDLLIYNLRTNHDACYRRGSPLAWQRVAWRRRWRCSLRASPRLSLMSWSTIRTRRSQPSHRQLPVSDRVSSSDYIRLIDWPSNVLCPASAPQLCKTSM